MSVCYECSVLSFRSLLVGLITHTEESYLVWCVLPSVIVKPRDLGGPGPRGAVGAMGGKNKNTTQC